MGTCGLSHHTKRMPSLVLVEPRAAQKHYQLAAAMAKASVACDRDAIKARLKEMRCYAVANMAELGRRFCRSVAGGDASVAFAKDVADAVGYVVRIASDTKTIAVCKSSTVNEMRAGLEKSGYALVDTYSQQFSHTYAGKDPIRYPWQLPTTSSRFAWDTFGLADEIRQREASTETEEVKDLTALVTASAAAAEDGTIFFLEHTGNIGAILRQASRLIVVVGLEKIVPSAEDALFQSRCAGAFGMNSVLLDMKLDDTNRRVNILSNMPATMCSGREWHIILLDDGRTSLAEGKYEELLRCIGCRACAIQCPGYRNLKEFEYYPREYLWLFLMGSNPSLELCVHCSMCEMECPVDIRLSKLMAQAKAEYLPRIADSWDNRVLTNMTRIAPAASFVAPLVNRLLETGALRILLERGSGIDRRRKLPAYHYATFERWVGTRHG